MVFVEETGLTMKRRGATLGLGGYRLGGEGARFICCRVSFRAEIFLFAIDLGLSFL